MLVIIPRLITLNCATSLISHIPQLSSRRRVSPGFLACEENACTKFDFPLPSPPKNVRRVALNLIELVNPRRCVHARPDKETYIGGATCRIRRVIRFYDFRATVLLAAAVATALTIRESGRRMQQRHRRMHRRIYNPLCLPSCHVYMRL